MHPGLETSFWRRAVSTDVATLYHVYRLGGRKTSAPASETVAIRSQKHRSSQPAPRLSIGKGSAARTARSTISASHQD